MSTNDSEEPAATFRTTVFLEAVWLSSKRHPCTLFGDATGRITFGFPDSAQLQAELADFRDSRAQIAPSRWEKVKRALRAAMDAERERAREADPDLAAVSEWHAREAERARIAAQPTGWTRIREQQREQESASLRTEADRLAKQRRAAWTSSENWTGPRGEGEG